MTFSPIFMYDPDAVDLYFDKPCTPKKCTCGTQIVGGLCSSWCDLVRPAEAEEPEPPPGAQLVRPPPQPTPGADGTHAHDVVCKCGRWIIKRRSIYSEPDTYNVHAELGCF